MELEPEDYNEILNWFTHTYARNDSRAIGESATRTFWKISFLVEEKIKELKSEKEDLE
jgi:hypothetical protein|tara:strand:+ start:4321 stop:4494 length:174 start_codon:yes stop_codon:yes gene_type:complete